MFQKTLLTALFLLVVVNAETKRYYGLKQSSQTSDALKQSLTKLVGTEITVAVERIQELNTFMKLATIVLTGKEKTLPKASDLQEMIKKSTEDLKLNIITPREYHISVLVKKRGTKEIMPYTASHKIRDQVIDDLKEQINYRLMCNYEPMECYIVDRMYEFRQILNEEGNMLISFVLSMYSVKEALKEDLVHALTLDLSTDTMLYGISSVVKIEPQGPVWDANLICRRTASLEVVMAKNTKLDEFASVHEAMHTMNKVMGKKFEYRLLAYDALHYNKGGYESKVQVSCGIDDLDKKEGEIKKDLDHLFKHVRHYPTSLFSMNFNI